MLLVLTDGTVFFAAGAVALAVTRTDLASFVARPDVIMALAFAAAIVIMIYERVGLYRRSFTTSPKDEIYAAFAASVLGMIPPVLVLVLLPSLAPFRHQIALAVLFSAGGLSATRFALHALRDVLSPPAPRRIAIAGKPERVDVLPANLSLTQRDAILRQPLEWFDEDLEEVLAHGDVERLPWLQNAIAWNCDTLIVTEALPPALMPAILRVTEVRGIKLAIAPMRIRPHACDFDVSRDGGVALLFPRSLSICTPGAEIMRRVFDLAIALPAVLLLSPLLLALALAIVIDSGPPVFYRQRRVGRRGHEFDVFKFRTMSVDAEDHTGPTWAKPGEARVTRFGRWLRRTSLDELPQLLNVVRGDMSIVGPRPERPFYVERFRAMLPRYEERHLVRPGITGWAQINMHRVLDPSSVGEKLSYDLFYLEHWSVFLDAMIILKTAAEFLFHSPA